MGDGTVSEASGDGLMTKVIVEKEEPERGSVEGCGGSKLPARAW